MMKYITAIVFALCLIGCSKAAYINNPSYTASSNYTQQEMQTAIINSLQARGWTVEGVTDNNIIASLYKGNVSAKIDIGYTPNTYNIKYVSSVGLKAKPEKNEISKKYNKWITNLDSDIRQNLSSIKFAK